MRIAIVYGTRPEAVKLWKVVEALRQRGVEPTIIATGQHTSLLAGTPAENALAPNVTLAIPSSNDPMGYVKPCVTTLKAVFTCSRPDVIVVQGDTVSAYAGALAGRELEIPVAHVEAGIRSGDLLDPWPEEEFRVEIDRIAGRRFGATEWSMENLTRPDVACSVGAGPWVDVLTGNPGIDALYSHTQPITHPQKVQNRVMVTLHRRESFGDPLVEIAKGVIKAAKKYPSLEFVWPVHPNPKVREAIEVIRPEIPGNLLLIDPPGMVTFAHWLSASRAVITDSGGVQEEAAALGVPCVVAREKTDRPESVEVGLAQVAGRTATGVLESLSWAVGYGAKATPSDCFGDGKAGPRIAEHLLQ